VKNLPSWFISVWLCLRERAQPGFETNGIELVAGFQVQIVWSGMPAREIPLGWPQVVSCWICVMDHAVSGNRNSSNELDCVNRFGYELTNFSHCRIVASYE
jgi:hypothetical protein